MPRVVVYPCVIHGEYLLRAPGTPPGTHLFGLMASLPRGGEEGVDMRADALAGWLTAAGWGAGEPPGAPLTGTLAGLDGRPIDRAAFTGTRR